MVSLFPLVSLSNLKALYRLLNQLRFSAAADAFIDSAVLPALCTGRSCPYRLKVSSIEAYMYTCTYTYIVIG